MKNPEINLCSLGEIWDEDGDALFESNLAEIFDFLLEKNLLKNKEQEYVFFVSKISYVGGIHRYEKKRKGTILKFLNYWEITFKEPFSESSLENFQQKRDFQMEAFEKEAERNSAWSIYGAVIRAQNERKEYQQANKLPDGIKQQEIKKLNERSNFLIIGG